MSMNCGSYNHRNNNNRRVASAERRRREVRRNSFIKCGLIVAIVTLFAIAIGRIMTVSASDDGKKQTNELRYYTSISIESEDTLWDLAQEYNNGEESNNHYINSIKELNNMNADTLYSGQNLIVYYYSDEVKE